MTDAREILADAMIPRVEFDEYGIVAEAFVPSKGHPEREPYRLVRAISGRWSHADSRCEGWTNMQRCYHVTALEEVMATEEQTDETRSITVSMNPLALLDAVDLDSLMSEKLVPSEHHIYSFRVKGQLVEGVSIDGVRDAARALSTKGEAVRELWVHLEREDEREAYFLACSARYAVAPDGREICMDTAIRAKRQPKWAKKADGSGDYFIDAWFEIGVAKAARNATEALLPEALKDHIKEQARKLMGTGGGNGAAPAQKAPRQQEPKVPLGPAAEARAHLRDLLTRAKAEMLPIEWPQLLQELRGQFPQAHPNDGGLVIGKLSDRDVEECTSVVARWLPAPDAAPGNGPSGLAPHAQSAPAAATARPTAPKSAPMAPSSLMRVKALIDRLVSETDLEYHVASYEALREQWPDAFDAEGVLNAGRTAVSEGDRQAMIALLSARLDGPPPEPDDLPNE